MFAGEVEVADLHLQVRGLRQDGAEALVRRVDLASADGREAVVRRDEHVGVRGDLRVTVQPREELAERPVDGARLDGGRAAGVRSTLCVCTPARVNVMGRLVQSSPIFRNSRLKRSMK